MSRSVWPNKVKSDRSQQYMGHFGYMLSQSTGIWYFMMVLTTTKSISRVFRLTSGEGK